MTFVRVLRDRVLPPGQRPFEVEPGVILLVEVSVGLTDDYSKDDDALLAAACDILDTFLPMVTAQIPE